MISPTRTTTGASSSISGFGSRPRTEKRCSECVLFHHPHCSSRRTSPTVRAVRGRRGGGAGAVSLSATRRDDRHPGTPWNSGSAVTCDRGWRVDRPPTRRHRRADADLPRPSHRFPRLRWRRRFKLPALYADVVGRSGLPCAPSSLRRPKCGQIVLLVREQRPARGVLASRCSWP
jgi:hypothetical protein